uniref:Cadherin domain-containing protein n=1 Tax=Panagrolaimus sp. PS1159 TaxID=55785 RepID=A0AC35GV97_9BILA
AAETEPEIKTETTEEEVTEPTPTLFSTEIDTASTEPDEIPTSIIVSSLPTETTLNESITEEVTDLTTTNVIVPLTFEQPTYSFMVENQRRGSKVDEIQLVGAHLGSNLQLEITPPEMAEIFRVDSETNEIFLKKVPETSQEAQEYIFNVTVFDPQNPERQSQTEISVSMMPFVVNPSEGPSEETMFPSISTTEEESPIPSTSETTLETKIPDIEAPSAKPIATSTGISTTDALLDLRFASTQFTATLPEGRYSNAIISLKPAPLNKGMPSGVLYSIDFSTTMKNETFPFSIREDNGIINVFGEIDREFNDLYEFIVTATLKQGDQEISDSALVQVRIDDVN